MSNHSPRVFVLEHCNVDVSKAKAYGELTYLFGRDDRRASIWDDAFKQNVVDKLASFQYDPAVDFFVVAGHMVSVVIVVGILARRYTAPRVLFYSAIEHCYTTKELG